MASTGIGSAVGKVTGTLDSDLGAWAVSGLAATGSTLNVVLLAESELQDACAKMHKINESQGWY